MNLSKTKKLDQLVDALADLACCRLRDLVQKIAEPIRKTAPEKYKSKTDAELLDSFAEWYARIENTIVWNVESPQHAAWLDKSYEDYVAIDKLKTLLTRMAEHVGNPYWSNEVAKVLADIQPAKTQAGEDIPVVRLPVEPQGASPAALEQLVRNLLNDVADRNKIFRVNQFNCPHVRALANAVFPDGDVKRS